VREARRAATGGDGGGEPSGVRINKWLTLVVAAVNDTFSIHSRYMLVVVYILSIGRRDRVGKAGESALDERLAPSAPERSRFGILRLRIKLVHPWMINVLGCVVSIA